MSKPRQSYHRRTKKDGNHNEIVKRYEQYGAKVVDLSSVGGGVPDILVGISGLNLLREIKNPDGRDKVGPDQKEFMDTWRGDPPKIIRTNDDVDNDIKEIRRKHGKGARRKSG